MCKSWLQYYLFALLYLFLLFIYFTFWDRQGCFPRYYVSSSVMRKSDLRNSLSLKFCWLNCFIFFERLILTKQNPFKVLDLKTIFWFFERRKSLRNWTFEQILDFWKARIVKALDLEMTSWFFDEMKKFMSWFYLVLAH